MSEIDVSKCEFLIINNDKYLCRCIKSDLFGGIEFVENAKSGTCKDNPNCYYKQLQRYRQCLDEIEGICKVHTDFCKDNKKNCELCPHEPCEDILILEKIKEVKE